MPAGRTTDQTDRTAIRPRPSSPVKIPGRQRIAAGTDTEWLFSWTEIRVICGSAGGTTGGGQTLKGRRHHPRCELGSSRKRASRTTPRFAAFPVLRTVRRWLAGAPLWASGDERHRPIAFRRGAQARSAVADDEGTEMRAGSGERSAHSASARTDTGA